MSDSKFCTKCGGTVGDNTQYCQQCGEPVLGTTAFQQREQMYNNMEKQAKESRILWISFFLVIYCVPALILSLSAAFHIDSIVNTAVANEDFAKFMAEAGITVEEVRNYVSTFAYLMLGSALSALVSLICVVLRKYWIIAVIGCGIASLLAVFSIFGVLIGLMVTWMIYTSKDSFDLKEVDESTKTN